MSSYEYLAVMAACVAITLPLELLGARVYRRPLRVARAVLPVALVFLVWDAIAIAAGVWDFNPVFVTGVTLLAGIPLEELVFFLVIPLCALLTYESVENLLPALRSRMRRARRDDRKDSP